jgi:hypothetical protein
MLDFGWSRGAVRSGAAPHQDRPAPGAPGPFLYPLQHRGWERPTSARASRSTTGWPSGVRPAGCRGTATCRKRKALREAPPRRRARRRRPVLGRPGRRRPAHDARCARTASAYGALSPTGPGVEGCCARASGSSASSRATTRGRRLTRSAPGRSSTPPGSGPTTPRRWPAAGPVQGARVEGRAPARAARPDPRRRGHPAHRQSRCCSSSRGAALDHRHHRHRLEPRQGHPAVSRPTSTTCSTGQPVLVPRCRTRTSRASTPGCGRCCTGESTTTSQAVPRARRGPPGAPAW